MTGSDSVHTSTEKYWRVLQKYRCKYICYQREKGYYYRSNALQPLCSYGSSPSYHVDLNPYAVSMIFEIYMVTG